jgi:hypothetical protein
LEKLEEILEAKIKEFEKIVEEETPKPAYNAYNMEMNPTQFQDQKGDLDGTAIFFVKQDDNPIRDFLIEMSFSSIEEKEGFGTILDALSQNIVDNGSVSVSFYYTGFQTKKRSLLTLSKIVGINSNIIPSENYLKSKAVDHYFDTNKVAS